MPRRELLSPEQRWLAVTRFATALPVLYDLQFRERVGEEYDLLEQHIWVSLAAIVRQFATGAGLPAGDAREIMETLETILLTFFGPEFRMEEALLDEERGVLVIKRCPFAFREKEIGTGPENLLPRCLAFAIATVEALNPAFTLRFVRSMCMGDRTCELKITWREDAERDDGK